MLQGSSSLYQHVSSSASSLEGHTTCLPARVDLRGGRRGSSYKFSSQPSSPRHGAMASWSSIDSGHQRASSVSSSAVARSSSSSSYHHSRNSTVTGSTAVLLDAPCQSSVSDASQIPELQGVPNDFADRYELVEKLGAGEYGHVWSAVCRTHQTRHAVKVMPKARPDRSIEENIARIECEIDIWKKCQDSEFVIKCDGVYQDEHNIYLVQELCHGGDIRAVLNEGRLTERQAAEVMRAVLDVIAVCHSNGFTFGDIKPANFLLKEPLQRPSSDESDSEQQQQQRPLIVRATDFGFSRDCQLIRLKRMGSPIYMAPELWCDEVGPQADVWAAGMMMYQMLSGSFPFWDQPVEEVQRLPLHQVMMAVSSYPIRLTGAPWDEVSKPAKDLIMAMLDRNSATRITSSQALCHKWLHRMLGYTPTLSFSSGSYEETSGGSSSTDQEEVEEWFVAEAYQI